MRYFVVDDDQASRRMLRKIIEESSLGVISGEASSGAESLSMILSTQPDIVLIDLLMPGLDGTETIDELRKEGYQGRFIMISQVVNKDMVGEAYEKGVEFFIHKPINRAEVKNVLEKTAEHFRLKDSLRQIKESISLFDTEKTPIKQRNIKEIVISILGEMGIIGESGVDDIISMTELLIQDRFEGQMPPLKTLYEAVALQSAAKQDEVNKEVKAIEQRTRRTLAAAANNLATLGAIDYTNPEFEYYAPRYFDFQEIRNLMKQMDEGSNLQPKAKINVKKFLQTLYLEVSDIYLNGPKKEMK